jgi:serine/threonine protein kinase
MDIREIQGGRYQLLRQVGSGGMGEVYLMQDTRVSRQVAIKVIRSEGAPYPGSSGAYDTTRLFQREAKAIAALEHPNILPLYDFGEERREGATLTYMVMPYCADGSLQDWLRLHANRILPPQDVAYLLEQAAEALQFAHDHEVIHLDVKPSNFLLRSNKRTPDRPLLLLADFGIARNYTTVASASLTIRGTPTSMAPEQWSSSPVYASDQYALAVMVYELLAGRPPFVGSMEQLMYQHFHTPPPAPSTFNPQVPAAYDAVLLRALAKKPEDRFPSIADFAAAFAEAVKQESSTSQAQIAGRNSSIDFYATLSVSPSEANAGMSRMITLPSGREVPVQIPPGAQDGQIIRLPESADQAEEIVLTIAIQPSKPSVPEQEAESAGTSNNTPQISLRSPAEVAVNPNSPTISTSLSDRLTQAVPPPVPAHRPASRARIVTIASVIVILLLLSSGAFYFFANHQSSANQPVNTNSLNHQQTPTTAVKSTVTATPATTPTPQPGLYIAATYNGSMFNEATQQTTTITVFLVQTKGYAPLKGSVTFKSPPQGVYLLNGSVDTKGNFSFSVQQPAGQTPLFLYGTIQTNSQGTFLHGNYCSASAGPCLSNTGYFTAGPGY